MDNTPTTERKPEEARMSKAEAIGILAKLAMSKSLTLEQLIAIQVAMRSTMKRLFDRERNWKRRHERDGGAYFTPPAALEVVAGERPLDAILANPPLEAANPEAEEEGAR